MGRHVDILGSSGIVDTENWQAQREAQTPQASALELRVAKLEHELQELAAGRGLPAPEPVEHPLLSITRTDDLGNIRIEPVAELPAEAPPSQEPTQP